MMNYSTRYIPIRKPIFGNGRRLCSKLPPGTPLTTWPVTVSCSLGPLIWCIPGSIVTKPMACRACICGQDAGASLLFPPQYQQPGAAQTAVLLVIRRDPHTLGYCRSRWSLALLHEACPWIRVSTAGGLSQICHRLRIRRKQSRAYLHSPDRHYLDKLSRIELARLRAWYDPDRVVLLYLDEFTYYRQPTLAQTYELAGSSQPLAYRSYASDTPARIVGALDAISGRVLYRQQSRITLACLRTFWQDLRNAYPAATIIYVVVDNWPIHYHPDVLAPLQPQAFPWPPTLPASWPTAPRDSIAQDQLPIQLLSLPTYASWLNPIEKLWRWLKQEVLHLHRLSDQWEALKERVTTFLNQFANGSPELLHYVGLLPT
jgi:hypothetical protein